MQKKKFFFVVAIVCLVIVLWAAREYTKPRQRMANAVAAFTLPATELYNAYSQSEDAANKKFTGKIVEVSGHVTSVDTADNSITIVLGNGEMGGVRCTLQNFLKNPPSLHDSISIKGTCTGFLLDVNITDAEITNTFKP